MTGMTGFYGMVARLTYIIINYAALGMIIHAIFRVDQYGNIKIISDTKYKKTSLYVYVVLFIAVVYFHVIGYVQDSLISFLVAAGWKTIPIFFTVSASTAIWLEIVVLGKSWKLKMVETSLLILGGSLALILVF